METLVAVGGAAVGLPTAFYCSRLWRERALARSAYAALCEKLALRAALVPQLLEAARAHEEEARAAIAAVAQMLESATRAKDCETRLCHERGLSERLATLMAQPALAHDPRFHALAGRLAELEGELDYARRFYNGAAREYRRRLAALPWGLVARGLGLRAPPAFETTDPREVELML
ncbi:MAG TPA: LemA family protein [Burkholderiales bacterium]|nr:LemA family protein [Burkholderiales bacterium]